MTANAMLRIAACAAAATALSALALDPPRPNSHGSKGDFTAADEGKSSTPVPPATIANAAPNRAVTDADRRLTDKVVKALNSDFSLQGAKITVLAANGDVSLSGSVKSPEQADKAEAIARKASGKAKISNALSAG